ncbi:hypothetical protein MP638_002406 [Amoeboaphelidium occidentale]|nr:hypothetical protein MP638_002406 [Amoeboaphelidium occidentale]
MTSSSICLVKHSDSKDYYSSLLIKKEEDDDESFFKVEVDGNSNYQKMKILLGIYDTTGDKRLKDILPSTSITNNNNKKISSSSSSSSSSSCLKRNSLVKIPALIDHNTNSSLREFSFGPQYDSTDCNISYSEYYSYYCCNDGMELDDDDDDDDVEVDQSISTQTQLTDVLTTNTTTTTNESGVDELIQKYSTTSTSLDSLVVEFQKEFHSGSAAAAAAANEDDDLNGLIGKGWDLLMELKRIQDDRINLLKEYDSTDCNISYSEYYSYYCCNDGMELDDDDDDDVEVDQSISTQTQLTDVLTTNTTTTTTNTTTTNESGVDELIQKYSTTSTSLDSLVVEFQKEFHSGSAAAAAAAAAANEDDDLNGLIGKGWDLLMELKRIQDDRINLLKEVDISSDELIVYMKCKSIVLELIKRMEGQQVVSIGSKKQEGVDYGCVVYRNEYGYNGVMKDGNIGNISGGGGDGMIPPQLLPKGGI